MRRYLHRSTALLLMALLGCYSYVETGLPTLERGDRVRVYLSEPATFDVGELTANNIVRMDAEVVRWDEEELVLSAWWLTAAAGREFNGNGRTVYVPRGQLDAIERRSVNGLQTGLLVAGSVAGLVALGAAVGGGIGGGGGDGPPNGQQQ